MAGNLVIPNTIGVQPGPKIASALLDQDYQTIADYINVREVTFDVYANRPLAGVRGRLYFATDVLALFGDNGSTWLNLSTTLFSPPGYIYGNTIGNGISTPNTELDVGAGLCTASDNLTPLSLLANTAGLTTGLWQAGDAKPKLDAGAIGNNQWWHVFIIGLPVAGTPTTLADILFSLSPTTPTMPAGYTAKRRIGSFRTDGAAHILTCRQDGDYFVWGTPVLDVNATNPGTAAVTRVLTVPTGVSVHALFNAQLHQATTSLANLFAIFTDLAESDVTPASQSGALASLGNFQQPNDVWASLKVRTDQAASIRSRLFASDANTVLSVSTYGWYDTRGRNGSPYGG